MLSVDFVWKKFPPISPFEFKPKALAKCYIKEPFKMGLFAVKLFNVCRGETMY